MNAPIISKTLKERRKSAGITQKDVAELSGVAIHTISDLESGKGNPTLEVLDKICDVLGLELTIQPKNLFPDTR